MKSPLRPNAFSVTFQKGRLHLVKQFKALKDHWASNDSVPGVHFFHAQGTIWEAFYTARPPHASPPEPVLLWIERWWVWVTLACCGLSRHRVAVLSKSMSLRRERCHPWAGEGKQDPQESKHTHTHTHRHAFFTPTTVTSGWQQHQHGAQEGLLISTGLTAPPCVQRREVTHTLSHSHTHTKWKECEWLRWWRTITHTHSHAHPLNKSGTDAYYWVQPIHFYAILGRIICHHSCQWSMPNWI